ncbi:MAG TPA: hypothetical protein VK067_06670 [Pseudogracilibacillus sp.]|nr:hypothetical protein [Pseudogracilibacillus sp.]
MRVKTITGFTESGLDKKVNKFMENNTIEIIDIQYSASLFYMGAMIIYSELDIEIEE